MVGERVSNVWTSLEYKSNAKSLPVLYMADGSVKEDFPHIAIAFDHSLCWNNYHLVQTATEHLASFPETEKRLWFAGSDATDLSIYTKEVATLLKASNKASLKWSYSDEAKETHTTVFRATKKKTIVRALNTTE